MILWVTNMTDHGMGGDTYAATEIFTTVVQELLDDTKITTLIKRVYDASNNSIVEQLLQELQPSDHLTHEDEYEPCPIPKETLEATDRDVAP